MNQNWPFRTLETKVMFIPSVFPSLYSGRSSDIPLGMAKEESLLIKDRIGANLTFFMGAFSLWSSTTEYNISPV
ncbi:MAG: hypothetical protein AAF399_28490, partial [Bacteroidota bacterium]